MIRDLLHDWGEVNLFTRQRRFGKSLNMSMLKAFFEIGSDKTLFAGLEISKDVSLCEEYMGKFPVIFVSLKSVSGSDFETARALLCSQIGREALRFSFLQNSDKLTEQEKAMYRKLVNTDAEHADYFYMSDDVLMGSLNLLSALLQKHYDKKVIILIDEYDVLLAKVHENRYYEQMVELLRGLFDQTLKSNASLYFAVLTGCLRVAKESIFTGLNNLQIFSIATVGFNEYFGFTDQEVRTMLDYYGFLGKYDQVKEWYDGYRFGYEDVYCPWDVIQYCADLRRDFHAEPKDHWSNTSSNDVVRHFIEHADAGATKSEIEALVAGETITKEIREDLTYNHLYDSMENIWSVLFTTGYLTQYGKVGEDVWKLAIPNREIRKIFTRQIMEMFKEVVAKDGELLKAFCMALQTGNAIEVEKQFTAYLGKTISIRDTYVRKERKENFYHGIILGILGFKDGWRVISNGESGDGYSDIMVEIESEDVGIIVELKYAERAKYTEALQEAFDQIQKMNYVSRLKDDGCLTIYKYGIACFKKKCKVKCEKEEYSLENE